MAAAGRVAAMLTKRLIALLLAGALLPAAAADAKTAKFTVTYQGTFTTQWDTPRYQFGTATCFEVPWRKAQGSETWGIKTRGKGQKVVVSGTSNDDLSWRNGTHSLTGEQGEVLATGLIERSVFDSSGWDAGKCAGATSGVHPPRKNDCGTLLPTYALSFTRSIRTGGGLVVLPMRASTARDDKQHFTNCTLIQEDGLTVGAWPDEPARVDTKKLFGRAKTVTLKGGGSWRQVLDPGRAGATTTTSRLAYTVKLTRVR